ncbi:PepSY domain-containing protein [Evansella halocellulosilytica]|uniref:PepSY domain-containing protein n=1 Tax=Evansella halocellulosilytica TaxID=2011013 RepID=UPI000BB81D01|nr:PepSY domain-containing protein [Evansella halocellulosilytica]
MMNKKTIVMMISGCLLLSLVLIFTFITDTEAALSEADVQSILEDRYRGEAKAIAHSGSLYEVEFHSPFGQYLIEVDQNDGTIVSFTQTSQQSDYDGWEEGRDGETLSVNEIRDITRQTLSEDVEIQEATLHDEADNPFYRVKVVTSEGDGSLEIDARTGEVLLYTVEEEAPPEPISEQEAINIALSEHTGEIDDIDLEEQDGRLVYEIEVENDDTGIDADIIIDAYTGEVLSVEYDD